MDAEQNKSDPSKIFHKFLQPLEKRAVLVPMYYGGNILNEVMSMEKSNPYSFYVVLADGIMEIPQESNLSWITLFYALPKELVEKRPAYLELPRNIHQLLHSERALKHSAASHNLRKVLVLQALFRFPGFVSSRLMGYH